jgi:hypothetical protein
MILSIDVAFIHCPHRVSAGWHADALGLSQDLGDDGWRSILVTEGSRFAIDFASSPRSTVERQAVNQLSQRKALAEAK